MARFRTSTLASLSAMSEFLAFFAMRTTRRNRPAVSLFFSRAGPDVLFRVIYYLRALRTCRTERRQ